jgi:ferric-dicitrate binding protein FerR (iron transport regulator)
MKFIDSEIMERYLKGESDAQEKHKVLMWLMLNLKAPSADDDFAQLLERIPKTEVSVSKQRVKSRLDSILADDRTQSYKANKKRHILTLRILLFAACVAIVFLSLSNIHTNKNNDQVMLWKEMTTSYGEKMSVTLPDSSIIWLHNDSKIIYPDSFQNDIRQVFVCGEIYADITKDSRRPFVVSSDSVNVVVTGTTFNFRAYPEMQNVELTLLEGAVSLDCITRQGRQKIDIIPGETVTVNMNNGNVSKYLCEPETYTSWKERRALYFNDQTLESIVKELQREFGQPIKIVDKALGTTRHFASFVNDESLMEILDALCTHSGMRVKEKDHTIYIYNN